MPQQIVDIADMPHFMLNKPMTWYRWSCNQCGNRGKTTERHYQCHPGKTRIVLDDGDE